MRCYLCGAEDLPLLTTELRYGTGNVFHCAACDLAALESDGEDLAAYYRDEYRRLHGPVLGEPVSHREIFDAYAGHQGARLELLRPYLSADTRFLEVGCSTGQFLHHVRPLVGEAVGVDYDGEAAAFAAEATGAVTYGVPLEETDLEPGSFDVVTAIQTMEHVPDPIAFAELLGRYLKPDGLLHVEVPNLHDPLLALYDSPGYRRFYYHRAHLFYFSARSLEAALARAGFAGRVEFVHDYNLLNHLHWLVTDGPQASSGPGLGPSRLPLAAGVSEEARADLESLLDDLDARYKALLAKHGVAENLVFLGRRT